jgi:sigma-B regulation protein RsbU (phosphoserine phosphatase)
MPNCPAIITDTMDADQTKVTTKSGVQLSSSDLLPLIDNNVADLIAVIDADKNRLWHNEAYCRTLGYTREELAREDSQVKVHPDDLPAVAATFEQAMSTGVGAPCAYRMQRKDGQWLYLESNARVVDLPQQGRCLILVARDVTERVRLENQLKKELAEAADYATSLLPLPQAGPVQSDWIYIPSTSLGGDSFYYEWIDEDYFRFCLLDVCGHGIGAALLSISAVNALRSRNLPNADFLKPAEVMRAINLAFPMEEQGNRFFTMWYGVYHRPTGQLTYASAGHPGVVLYPSPDAAAIELETRGAAIGLFEESVFEEKTIALDPGSILYIFSDGVFELVDPSGREWPMEQFIESLRPQSQDAQAELDRIIHIARTYAGTDGFEDDYSMIRFALIGDGD